jgi:hypothetical protein
MAVTIANVAKVMDDNGYVVIADITGPASYTTAGETLTAAQQNALFPQLGSGQSLDFTKATFVVSEQSYVASGAHVYGVSIDKANNKCVFHDKGTEVTSTTNLTSVTVRVRITYGIVSKG